MHISRESAHLWHIVDEHGDVLETFATRKEAKKHLREMVELLEEMESSDG